MTRTAVWPVGINPIGWTNDDFPDLGDDISLDRCLAEMKAAGYEGTELGRKYPRDPVALRETLARHDLRLVSGWHSTHLADASIEQEWVALKAHLDLLRSLGADVCIVAECTHRTYHLPEMSLSFDGARPVLRENEWASVITGYRELTARAGDLGMCLAYHHHTGTVIQTRMELDRLLAGVPGLSLLYDPGHLALTGVDPLKVLDDLGSRIIHVHLKNIRPAVAERVRREHWSFHRAVCEGVFSVPGDGEPGDGSVDFVEVLDRLARIDYRGWLVVEAEDDPQRADPLKKARRARDFIRKHAGV